MKNFNADTPVVRLRTKQKALNTELVQLKKEITSETGTERKKRALLKQINSTEKTIKEIDKLIREEKKKAVKQFTKQPEEMFRTPPKKLNTTFVESNIETERQPTLKNTDPDIIDTNISTEYQASALPSAIPQVTFSIADDPITLNTPTTGSIMQTEMNRPNLQNINEKSTGAISKLRRSNRTLDFSTLDPTQSTLDPFELPRMRPNENTQNYKITQDAPGILTQTYALPQTSAIQTHPRDELNEFFNFTRNAASSNLPNYRSEHDTIYDSNLASKISAMDTQKNMQENIQYSQTSSVESRPPTQSILTQNKIPIDSIHLRPPPNTPNSPDDNISMQTNYSQKTSANMNLDPFTQILMQSSQLHSDFLQDAILKNLNYRKNEHLQHQNTPQSHYRQYPTSIIDTDFPFENDRLQINANIPSNNTQQNRPNQNLPIMDSPIVNRTGNHFPDERRRPFNNITNQSNNRITIARKSFLKRLEAIPIFRGETYSELRDFIDIADTLYVTILNQIEKDEFYHQLILQIRGEARNAIADLDETNWQSIRTRLREYFSYLANKDIINSKLENLRQLKNEPISSFADRARKLLREKNNTYLGLSEDQKIEHNRTARRAFAKGIADPKLRNRLLIRGANSLEDAIAYSIEAETDLMQEISSKELTCTYCKLTGHREKDCRKKDQSSNNLVNLISALQALNINSDNRRINQDRRRQYVGYDNRPLSRNSNYNNIPYRNENISNQRNDSSMTRYNNYNNSNIGNEYNRQRYLNQSPRRYENRNEYRYDYRNENRNDSRNENQNVNRNEIRNENRNDSRNSNRNGNRNDPSFPIRNFAFDADSENSSDSFFDSQSGN